MNAFNSLGMPNGTYNQPAAKGAGAKPRSPIASALQEPNTNTSVTATGNINTLLTPAQALLGFNAPPGAVPPQPVGPRPQSSLLQQVLTS